VIEVEGLRKVYPGQPPVVAVDEISFRARPGRIFGLLGPNGAGKTTTLRILVTVLTKTSGSVRVEGVEVDEDPAAVRRSIGFVSASTGVYERLTPPELLRYFGALQGLESAQVERRVAELVDMLDMGSFRDRFCGVLSTGQKQKVSIARALIHDPPVLIFDEPTSGLDVLVARALVEQIETLREARRTIVLSTHILHEAERLCDDVAIIHGGRICAQGTLAEVSGEAGLETAFFAAIDAASAAQGEASSA